MYDIYNEMFFRVSKKKINKINYLIINLKIKSKRILLILKFYLMQESIYIKEDEVLYSLLLNE